jgi:hypothetical protein
VKGSLTAWLLRLLEISGTFATSQMGFYRMIQHQPLKLFYWG